MSLPENYLNGFSVSQASKELNPNPFPLLNLTHPNELTTNGVCKKFIHGKCKAENCPHPHSKSKIKPCNKYENLGHCGYGDRCNFSHDFKICPDFKLSKCDKGESCPDRHIYKSCANFDMGFCYYGRECQFKHIVRKLCWDYTLGYCESGSKCTDHHAKVFVPQDFQQSKKLSSLLSKDQPHYFVCNHCAQIGHKINACPKLKQIQPHDVSKCGLCGMVHSLVEDCNYG